MSLEPIILQADAEHLPLASGSVDLVFTSPPYCDARTYGIGAQRHCADWIDWMLRIVTECCRVCNGLVLVNCAGVTRGRIYQPGPEGLLYEWWKRGGNCWAPAYWHRVGIPGSGGKHWLRKDVEYILCFKRDNDWPAFSDNTACGHPPKWGPGGEMSNRMSNGTRVNQWGPIGGPGGMTGRRMNGERKPRHRPSHRDGQHNNDQAWVEPVLANPGNLVKVIVGGGVMGSKLAHENEAPFPERLAEFFIKSFCRPGGIVLDPFGGSGTTAATARRLGRRSISADIRMNQCDLMRRRLAEVSREKREKPSRLDVVGQISLFEGAASK